MTGARIEHFAQPGPLQIWIGEQVRQPWLNREAMSMQMKAEILAVANAHGDGNG